MNSRIAVVTVIACLLVSNELNAQTRDTIPSRWRAFIDLDRYSKPFWKADTIVDETTMPINAGGKVYLRLLFKAAAIISVKSANYGKSFFRGKDWDLKDGQLVILPGSAIPVTPEEDLVFKNYKPGFSMTGKVPGTYVLFTERPFFSGLQLAVTYHKAKEEKWQGVVPAFAKKVLPGTISRLESGKGIKIVFYGNSIEAGYNTSDHMNTPPYMPTWPELVVYNLRRRYGEDISYCNLSVPGKMASWGLEHVATNLNPEKPNLVVIGFGMNDGASNVLPDRYRQVIEKIIVQTKKQNPNAEFILIAPMLPNPDAIQNGLQASYKAELDKLARKGIIVADMTTIHKELLKYKVYQDMTGNNVNHPNDYLARWYAQLIAGFLIP